MMKFSPLVDALISELQCQPGVGPKSAQRIAFHLLQSGRESAAQLAAAMSDAVNLVGHCERCRTFTENRLCSLCENPKRAESGQLCVVESPADVLAIEQLGHYSGRYFVLMGHLSPLDGVGPEQLGLEQLEAIFAEQGLGEVILATNPTVEGEATAYYIAELAKDHGIEVSRIAHGVPVGGSWIWWMAPPWLTP